MTGHSQKHGAETPVASIRRATSNVFSIPSGAPFLDTLVSSLLAGKLVDGFCPKEDPLCLPEATIFVPNRRTARALLVAFLAAGEGDAQLLPNIRTLGDVDEDEFGLAESLESAAEFAPAVSSLARKLQLAKLANQWVEPFSTEIRKLLGEEELLVPSSQSDAIRLSHDLCRLLDEVIREESGWNAINNIVPDEHAEWWELTSTFLSIVMNAWPKILEESGLMDPGERSVALLDQRVRHYEKQGSSGPIIVAGSTGSVPSTQRFLKVISGLSNGAIVLPGLDTEMSEEQWLALNSEISASSTSLESHPQFGLARLLRSLGVERDNVIELGQLDEVFQTRARLINTALALPDFSANWIEDISSISAEKRSEAMHGISLIEASNERQEALAIALCLRECLETANKSAALVTPDRNLARRVSIELERFGVRVDDTAGEPLASTALGAFIRQLLLFAFGQATRADITSLLKSPFLTAGSEPRAARQLGEIFEVEMLRGKIGMPIAGELSSWVSTQIARQKKTDQEDESQSFPALTEHLDRVDMGMAELVQLADRAGAPSIQDYMSAIAKTLDVLCVSSDDVSTLADTPGEIEFENLFEQVAQCADVEFNVEVSDFPSVFEALLAPLNVRSRMPTHPRLHIYGPLEIRLLDHDRVILAGLNEGTWPAAVSNDAFLNRLMRQQLGMASPERGTGLAAHDFQQMLGQNEVVLSRSSRVDKAPTIASRWVQRLIALIGEAEAEALRSRGQTYLDIANLLEQSPQKPERAKAPCPVPPVEVRPTRLPVTDIETWIRDPYALYAKRILNLRALDPLEREPDPLLKGTIYHAIAEHYVSLETMKLPATERRRLLDQIADEVIRAEDLPQDAETLWRLRFEEIAEQFVEWEEKHSKRFEITDILKEHEGGIGILNGEFYLHARADRIDILEDGSQLIIDYKTGGSPSMKQARNLAPQLALEGAIALRGGFDGVSSKEVSDLAFLRLRHGKNFNYESLGNRDNPLIDVVEQALSNLEALVKKFQDPSTGYVSRRAPFKQDIMDADYDHLARAREWSFGGDEADE